MFAASYSLDAAGRLAVRSCVALVVTVSEAECNPTVASSGKSLRLLVKLTLALRAFAFSDEHLYRNISMFYVFVFC